MGEFVTVYINGIRKQSLCRKGVLMIFEDLSIRQGLGMSHSATSR
jgi:hypothetical protein